MALRTLGGSSSGHDETEGEGAIVSEINITPLTDIFLVLLIIFMVTSSVMSQMGVDVNLPQASKAAAQAQPEGVIITLLPAGRIRVNQKEIGGHKPEEKWLAMEQALKAAFSQTPSRFVILEGDREAYLGSAISVMDYARRAGAEKFAIATSEEITRAH